MVSAKLETIRKTFNDGNVIAVDNIDLNVYEGEFLVLVGPSGCGKSTTLRCIAGLEKLDSGTVTLDGQDATGLPPKNRDISMVFQNYALYPSMTVFENMAFGINIRGAKKETIEQQVFWAAEMMGIGSLLERYPMQLSGGQQQRVALGRAIVRDPALFLLDEPLSNLDAKLRSVMRTEILELQRELGTAAVFVTHDQEEAMTMGDRIAVMNAGRIEQIDEPEVIYNDPANLFVAKFIGDPPINCFEMTVSGSRIESDAFSFELPDDVLTEPPEGEVMSQVIVGIRPSELEVVPASKGEFDVDVDVIELIGDRQIVYFNIEEQQYSAIIPASKDVEEGQRVSIDIHWPAVNLFDPNGPKILRLGDIASARTDFGADSAGSAR